MARISAIYFSRHCHRAIFFTLAPPRRAPPFSVRASGAQALKVAQVLSTRNWLHITLVEICENGLTEQYVYWHYVN